MPDQFGTAMRASVMLCLPMLTVSGRMESLSLQLGQMGLLLRGIYGEGTASAGCMYQLSNRITMGLSEEEIVERLHHATAEIITLERQIRTNISGIEKAKLTDRIQRSEGILRYAHTLTASEMLERLSDLRLGASMGLNDCRVEVMTSLLVEGMPATLSLGVDSPPKQDMDCEILRAKVVKAQLFGA